MSILNLNVGIKNPLATYKQVQWYQGRANIIYIPFPLTKFTNWYNSDQQLKQHYRTIIIPDKVTIGAMPVRRIQNYITEIKKLLKGVQVEKIIKNSISKPVIVDLSPVAYTFWQMINTRGIKYIAPDFFNFVNSIYSMIVSAKQLGDSNTVVVFDFTDEYNELDKLLLYLKLNDYEFPAQIADKYVFFRYKNNYIPLTADSSMDINKTIFHKLAKISTDKDNYVEPANNDVADNTTEQPELPITDELIKNVLLAKFNKNISDKLELDSIVKLTQQFINKHPDMDVNLGDQSELANLVKEALKNQVHIGSEKVSFDELLAEHNKQFVFKMNVDPDKIHSKKTIGINAIKATGVKWVTDASRTKIEFDENLDRNIHKLVESLDDPRFKMHVLGVEKEISDDGRSRYYNYKIKIKPEKGRAYVTKLRVPALVHDTYFKIGGNLYAINNQLMQLPIIKKNANTVQLKTNYSVTDYSIKAFPQNISDFSDIVTKFLNIMKSSKKLKDAEAMDLQTESLLKDYGLPLDEVAKINYKKIEIK